MSFLAILTPPTHAESLFRANAVYNNNNDPTTFTPRSLFTTPRPQNVGDIITILINESTTQTNSLQFRVSKTQTLTQNGTNLVNDSVRFILGKLPFGSLGGSPDVLPNLTGLDNANNIQTQAQVNKTVKYNDTITCQVVQILPNGYLLVQGKKTTMMNKEFADLSVTGIVNPYFIDKSNTIDSKKVANMQFMMTGKGVISRQQNDGFISKLYQFFN
jgi:flagellar L-ring protein FlgH